MRNGLRRTMVAGAIALAAALTGAGAGRAAPGGPPDVGHRISGVLNAIAATQGRAQTPASESLAADASCGFGPTGQVFLPWDDPGDYSLAPGGDVADPGVWSLQNVGVASDHDPWSASVASLQLGSGNSEAVSPTMCVTLADPTLRFFAVDRGGSGSGFLEVTALFQGVNGKQETLTIARIQPGGSWQPTPAIPIGINALAAVSATGWTPLGLDFRAYGLQQGETIAIAGIYVDPYLSKR